MIVSVDSVDYVLLPQPPLVGTSETLSFVTDVHESIIGTEEKILLTDIARQEFSYSLKAYSAQIKPLFDELRLNVRSKFLIPMIAEFENAEYLGANLISCDTSNLSIAVGQLILLSKGTSTEIHTVVDVLEDGIEVEDDVFLSDFIVQPLRRCIIDGSISSTFGSVLFMPSMNFIVLDGVVYKEEDTPPQHAGSDFYDWCILLDGNSIGLSMQQGQALVDSRIGRIWSFTDWGAAKTSLSLRFVMTSRAELFNLKRWFYRRKGRFNNFVIPVFDGTSKVNRKYRLASDSIQFDYKSANIVECTVQIIEVL